MEYEAGAAEASSFPDSDPEPGPVQPGDEVREELQACLAADSSRVGEMYRLLEEGLAADAIAERLEGGAVGAGSTGAWSGHCSTGTSQRPHRGPGGSPPVPSVLKTPGQLPPVHTSRQIWTNSSGAPATLSAWTKKDSGRASKPSKLRPATRPGLRLRPAALHPAPVRAGVEPDAAQSRPQRQRCHPAVPRPDPDDRAPRRAHPAADLPDQWNPSGPRRGSLPPPPRRGRVRR
jgi:hypothetical protein